MSFYDEIVIKIKQLQNEVHLTETYNGPYDQSVYSEKKSQLEFLNKVHEYINEIKVKDIYIVDIGDCGYYPMYFSNSEYAEYYSKDRQIKSKPVIKRCVKENGKYFLLTKDQEVSVDKDIDIKRYEIMKNIQSKLTAEEKKVLGLL